MPLLLVHIGNLGILPPDGEGIWSADSTRSEDELFADDRGGSEDHAGEGDSMDWESFKAEFSSGENDDG